jgi:acetyl esterase/lipase
MQEESFYTLEMQEEMKEYINELEKEQAKYPANNERSPVDIRLEMEQGGGRYAKPILLEEGIERMIPSDYGDIPVRAFIPKGQIDGIYLHIHGGGWVLGRAHYQDQKLKDIMDDCNAAVISVDYRLAPEHPYPAAQDDCEMVALWVIENAVKEFGTDNIVIGGESAGGHLSASTLIRMRDKHNYTGFKAANLAYGVYDFTMTPSQRLWGDRLLVLNTPLMQWFYDHYVPAAKRSDPDVSPLYAGLHDLPPALFTVGTLDLLLDDTLFMHSRWFASGNKSTLHVYPGATHGFDGQPTQLAEKVRAKMRNFISDAFRI